MAVASILMLTAALMVGGGDGARAERFTGLAVSRVDLVQESGSLPDVAPRLVDIAVGDRYNPASVRRAIKQLFALGAFSDIRVEAQVEEQGVALTFRLHPALKVAEVVFQGLDEGPGSLKELRKEIVEESGLRPGTVLDTALVEAAVEKIDQGLAREGFFWARTEPEVQFQSPVVRVIFHVQLGSQARLAKLRVDGVPSHIEHNVMRKIAVSPGDPYVPSALEKQIDKLIAKWKDKGYYEARVHIQETPEPPDQVGVDIEIEMGHRVIIEVEGAYISDRTLNRLIPVLKEQSVSEDLVEESRANLEAHFVQQGYRDAVATLERLAAGGGKYLLMRFHVEPGTKTRVGEVRVEGLSTVTSKEVLSLMATPPGRFRASPFRSQVWEDDLDEIRRYLRRKGFHRASVRGEVHERTGAPEVVDLTAHVEEGPQASIVAIHVDGVEQLNPTEILSAAGLEVGMPFYPPQVVEAREHLFDSLLNLGYQQAVVEVRSRLDETGTRASLGFEIHEGNQTYVDRVIFSGLEVTREEALRQEVSVRPKEPLSTEGLLETRQRLVGTGLFNDVSVEALPLDPSSESSDVLIRLEEGPRITFGYGFGYNEVDLARVEAEITRRNLFGRNRTASVFARAGVRGGRFVLTYRQPEFFGLDVPTFVTAFFEEGERKSFDFIQKGLGVHFTKRQSERRTYFFRYNYKQTRTLRLEVPPGELPREFRNNRLSIVSVSQVTDTRDDAITPSRGQLRLLDFEVSAKVIGSESSFLKGLAQQFFYFPLPQRMVGVIGLRFGVAQRQDVDVVIPITERFFAGGANTLRGFGLDLASPKDANGDPVGGNVLTLLNLELRFPIAGKLGGVLFSDNGTVYRRLSTPPGPAKIFDPRNWRYNLGFGFRYETPLGPLRVDMGFKLNRRLTTSEEGLVKEPLSRIHVSLGHAF